MKRTYIIAEAGVNHNGSIEMAKQLISIAADAGADAVKFQTFKASNLVSVNAPKAEYQQVLTNQTESQFDMLEKLELSAEEHATLFKFCEEKNIQFISAPFDIESVDLLDSFKNLPLFKIPSGEITNAPLLLYIARKKKSIILSTGMSTIAEIEQALSILAFGLLKIDSSPTINDFYEAYNSREGQKILKEKVTLLHCTTEYPAPLEDVNLNVLDTLSSIFGIPIGYSDHTEGISIPIAAVARGATIIEKHFTLDRSLEGPDHLASLEPEELKLMIQSIRQVELALGSPIKKVAASEKKNKAVARKSLVAKQNIRKGERFTVENLTTKRPGTGISPFEYWEWLDKIADKDYVEDEIID